ncbi:AraC family transcriptional regulator, partial [Klebsiella pneumoniae]|nr:AraC family transcriptional regulator [Klebsiella pneumoniae]
MADRLAALMTHFPMSAQVFNTGPLCGINTLQSDGVHGQLHLVRSGT